MNSQNTEGPMTLFRIFVEDVGLRDELRRIVSEKLEAVSVSYGEGFWKGLREQNAIIEVYGRESLRGTVTALAMSLKKAFGQQAVGIAEHSDRVSYYEV